MNCIAYIDGSSLGNPGDAAYGVVLIDEAAPEVIIEGIGVYLGQATNNVAEYHGLLGCLELSQKYGVKKLQVYSDSELLVRQMNGIYKIKNPHLQGIHEKIKTQLALLNINFEIKHIKREGNKKADWLARNAATRKENILEFEKRP